MRHAIFVGLLAAALAAPASAAVCARVTVLGRPLPQGLVSLISDSRAWAGAEALPGATERSLVRFEGGRFCLDGVAPGHYSLEVGPMGMAEPMPLAYEGLGPAADYRLTVDARGVPALYDKSGKEAARGELPALAFVAPAPEDSWTRLEASVSYSDELGGRCPASTLLTLSQRRGYTFAWLDAKDGRCPESFSARVPAEKIETALLSDARSAIDSLDPPYVIRGGDQHGYEPAQTVRLKVHVAPAATVVGSVVRPDGKPFAPYAGSRRDRTLRFGVCLTSQFAGQSVCGYADETGTYSIAAPKGIWQWMPRWEGQADPGWSVPQGSQARWLEPGSVVRADYRLVEGARFRVAKDGVRLEPMWQTKVSLYNPLARRLIAMPAGSFDPKKTFDFFTEDPTVALNQAEDGRWYSMNTRVGGEGAVAPPGAYDVYLVEVRQWVDYFGVRVLAARKGVELRAGKDLDFAFAEGDYYPSGEAAVSGSVKASIRYSFDEIEAVRTIADVDRFISPVINVYDAQDRFVGMTFGNCSNKQFAGLYGAFFNKSTKQLSALLWERPREFQLKGLPAGRYRAQVVLPGYAMKDFDLAVGPRRKGLDIDMDKL